MAGWVIDAIKDDTTGVVYNAAYCVALNFFKSMQFGLPTTLAYTSQEHIKQISAVLRSVTCIMGKHLLS